MRNSNILITGSPGIGKTTLLRKVADRLADRHPVGFYTREIREHGVRQGFELVALDGRRRTLAHVHIDSRHRVGKYGVDVDGFDEFLSHLRFDSPAGAPAVIDEIGKMECFSSRFTDLTASLLDSDRPVLATIALKGGGFIRRVKDRADCQLIEVTRSSRDRLENDLIGLVLR